MISPKVRVSSIIKSSCIYARCLSLADIISTVEFDHTGDYLATGDKGGRVVLFERNESVSGLVTVKRSLRRTQTNRSPRSAEKRLRIQILHRGRYRYIMIPRVTTDQARADCSSNRTSQNLII